MKFVQNRYLHDPPNPGTPSMLWSPISKISLVHVPFGMRIFIRQVPGTFGCPHAISTFLVFFSGARAGDCAPWFRLNRIRLDRIFKHIPHEISLWKDATARKSELIVFKMFYWWDFRETHQITVQMHQLKNRQWIHLLHCRLLSTRSRRMQYCWVVESRLMILESSIVPVNQIASSTTRKFCFSVNSRGYSIGKVSALALYIWYVKLRYATCCSFQSYGNARSTRIRKIEGGSTLEMWIKCNQN